MADIVINAHFTSLRLRTHQGMHSTVVDLCEADQIERICTVATLFLAEDDAARVRRAVEAFNAIMNEQAEPAIAAE